MSFRYDSRCRNTRQSLDRPHPQNYMGQVMGTSVSSKLYVDHGWRSSAGIAIGWVGFMLLVLLVRGPHCERYTWFGYEGGLQWRKNHSEDGELLKAQQMDQKEHLPVKS